MMCASLPFVITSVCKVHHACRALPHLKVGPRAGILPCDMIREKNKRRQPCRICKHKHGFKHYCKSCSRWFCPVCVRPGCHPCDQMADGSSVGAMSSTTDAPTVMQDAFDHTELQPGTRALVRYKPICQIETDCKLQQLVYERIILWRRGDSFRRDSRLRSLYRTM